MILRVDIIHQRGEGVDTETSASGAEVGAVQGCGGGSGAGVQRSQSNRGCTIGRSMDMPCSSCGT